MNKGELIESVATAAGMSRADATKAVDGVLESVTRTLSSTPISSAPIKF